MFYGPLPLFVDSRRLTDVPARLEGSVALTDLERLRALVATCEGDVAVVLNTRRDEQLRLQVHGRAEAQLGVLCQQCGELLVQPVTAVWEWVFAHSAEDERALVELGVDACFYETPLATVEMIEDELILALPMAPRHVDDCRSVMGNTSTPHPFAALKSMFERGVRND